METTRYENCLRTLNDTYTTLAEQVDLDILAEDTDPEEAAEGFMALINVAAHAETQPNEHFFTALQGLFRRGWSFLPEDVKRSWIQFNDEAHGVVQRVVDGERVYSLADAAKLLGVSESEVLDIIHEHGVEVAVGDAEPLQ